MKWQKVYKIYEVSEDGLLKRVKDRWSNYGGMFDDWYQTEEQAIQDIKNKTETHGINLVPDHLHIIPCMVKVLE